MVLVAINLYLPRWCSGRESACQCRRCRSDHWARKDPLGVGNGNLLKDSCLENPVDRGTWGAVVHGVTKSWTQLSG